jgi:tetratricopeptide (TPR) repeat protein
MTRTYPAKVLTGALAIVAVLVFAATASAQTGMLRGLVTDAEGKPIQDANITITAKGMNTSREVKTNKKGEWVQIGLFPGDYSVTAEKDGMKSVVDLRVSIGENPPIEMTLKMAGPSEEQVKKQEELQKLFDDGVTASKAGNYDESVTKFNEAIAMAPNCADCYYNIGYAHVQKKDWPQAEAAYRKAVELRPEYAEAWNGLANVLNAQGKADEALAASEKASSLGGGGAAGGGGGNANALYNQGVILWNQGKYAEAKEKFAEAAQADPTHQEALYRLGMAEVNLGNIDGAIAAFENYLKVAPDGKYAGDVKNFLASMKK